MILASKLMMEWLGKQHQDKRCQEAADEIESAIVQTFSEGIKTKDLGGSSKTDEFGDAVARRLII